MSAYVHHDGHWHREDAAAKAKAVDTLVAHMHRRPSVVGDVGSGPGYVLAQLRARWSHWDPPPSLWGSDPALQPSQVLPGLLAPPPARPTADLVLCLDVFEHVPDPVPFLEGLAQVAPWAIFRIPLDDNRWARLRPERAFHTLARLGHLHAYSVHSFLSPLTRAGWQPVRHTIHHIPSHQGPVPLRALRYMGHRLAPTWAADWLGGSSVMVLCQR